MIQLVCQILLMVGVPLRLLAMLYVDINGRSERKPGTFGDVVGTLIAVVLGAFVSYGAGAFSLILK